MQSVYHIIHFLAGLEKSDIFPGYETLAEKLAQSGRLRIDAGEDRINFARLYIPDLNISMMFSHREIHDKQLIPMTKQAIADRLSESTAGAVLDAKVEKYFKMLLAEIKKYDQPSAEDEMKLARLVVQATHPVVMELLLIDQAEIFLSYSYNIGDVLDIMTWQTSGTNSGMQSLDGRSRSIFISCGGDPLKANKELTLARRLLSTTAGSKESDAEYGDGQPAIARIMIIGGQEMGHYSDIKRDQQTGRQIMDRYSANISCTRAKPEASEGRMNDIKKGNVILKQLNELGLVDLMKQEDAIKLYRQMKQTGLKFVFLRLKLFIRRLWFYYKASRIGLYRIARRTSWAKYPANMLHQVVIDMLFNLAPKADVYSSDDKQAEEAIACVEALARVPQQVNKWGKHLTQVFMEDLYVLYYGKVIPDCLAAYQKLTGKPFSFKR